MPKTSQHSAKEAGAATIAVLRREAIRGVLTIHVYRDDLKGIYGFDNYTRVGPAANYAAVEPTLARIQSLIVFVVVGILVVFAVVTIVNMDPSLLAPSTYPGVRQIVSSPGAAR